MTAPDPTAAAAERVRRVGAGEALEAVYGDDRIGGFTPQECYEDDLAAMVKALGLNKLPYALWPAVAELMERYLAAPRGAVAEQAGDVAVERQAIRMAIWKLPMPPGVTVTEQRKIALFVCDVDAMIRKRGGDKPLDMDGPLPELNAAERKAMNSLPADFVEHLIAGERATFNPDGTFKDWTGTAPAAGDDAERLRALWEQTIQDAAIQKARETGEAIGEVLGNGIRDAFQKLQDENAALRADLAAAVGERDALANVMREFAARDCNCDVTEPKGYCCVGCRALAALRPAGDQAKGGG